jgi:hypothetical protein
MGAMDWIELAYDTDQRGVQAFVKAIMNLQVP